MSITKKKCVVYILPHHDDEIFVLPKIRQDVAQNCLIRFIYLTTTPERQKESRGYIEKIGVPQGSILSLPEVFYADDNQIVIALPRLFEEVKALLTGQDLDYEFVCTGFEGGHQDHDAAAVLTRALAKHFKSLVFEFSLYNSEQLPGMIYRVGFARDPNHSMHSIRYTFSDFKNLFWAPFFFKSQTKAMVSLLPFLFLRAVIMPLGLRRIQPSTNRIPWPKETPMYERWGRMTYVDFVSHVKKSGLLSPHELPSPAAGFISVPKEEGV